MDEQFTVALMTLDLMTLYILKEKGIIEAHEIQERLRKLRSELETHYGDGPATIMMETAMEFMAKNQPSNVVPFPKF